MNKILSKQVSPENDKRRMQQFCEKHWGESQSIDSNDSDMETVVSRNVLSDDPELKKWAWNIIANCELPPEWGSDLYKRDDVFNEANKNLGTAPYVVDLSGAIGKKNSLEFPALYIRYFEKVSGFEHGRNKICGDDGLLDCLRDTRETVQFSRRHQRTTEVFWRKLVFNLLENNRFVEKMLKDTKFRVPNREDIGSDRVSLKVLRTLTTKRAFEEVEAYCRDTLDVLKREVMAIRLKVSATNVNEIHTMVNAIATLENLSRRPGWIVANLGRKNKDLSVKLMQVMLERAIESENRPSFLAPILEAQQFAKRFWLNMSKTSAANDWLLDGVLSTQPKVIKSTRPDFSSRTLRDVAVETVVPQANDHILTQLDCLANMAKHSSSVVTKYIKQNQKNILPKLADQSKNTISMRQKFVEILFHLSGNYSDIKPLIKIEPIMAFLLKQLSESDITIKMLSLNTLKNIFTNTNKATQKTVVDAIGKMRQSDAQVVEYPMELLQCIERMMPVPLA